MLLGGIAGWRYRPKAMLPWLQGRPREGGASAPPLIASQEVEDEVGGLRSMAMRAIAQDLLSALESKDVKKLAYVLECLSECLVELGE